MSPFLYHFIYIIVISALTIYCIIKYSSYSETRVCLSNFDGPYLEALSLTILLIIFIGLRPVSIAFVDMVQYDGFYSYLMESNNEYEFDPDASNFIFDNLMHYLASNLYDVTILFIIMACLYFGGIFWGLKRIFPMDVFYALVIYLGAFSTFSYGTNGIKAGAAAAIFLLAFAYYKKPLLAALFCFLSLGFHHSMTLPIAAFILAYFIKNPKYFFWAWFICLFISIFHFDWITNILAGFTDEVSAERYILADPTGWSNKTGFRLDFVLYSLPPIIIGLWTIYKHKVIDRLYQIILCTYLATNAIWLLSMYVPYNNRIAYLSWFILPIASIYPFLKFKLDNRQYLQLNYIVGFFLVFTVASFFFL